MSNNTTKPRRKRSLAEREADLLAQLEALQSKKRAEELDNDPRFERINKLLGNLNTMFQRAKRTVNGKGRGKGAVDRIAELENEIAELRVRYERDSEVLEVIEEHISSVETIRNGIADGEIDSSNYTLPDLPDVLKPGNYTLTDAEIAREAEARARAEQTGKPEPEPNETPDGGSVTTETIETVRDADGNTVEESVSSVTIEN